MEGFNVDPRQDPRPAIQRRGEPHLQPQRAALRQETETFFSHLLREDLSVLELLTADYTFLNEPLAKFYGIKDQDIDGDQMRKSHAFEKRSPQRHSDARQYPAVTSNPTLTSPVKCGRSY